MSLSPHGFRGYKMTLLQRVGYIGVWQMMYPAVTQGADSFQTPSPSFEGTGVGSPLGLVSLIRDTAIVGPSTATNSGHDIFASWGRLTMVSYLQPRLPFSTGLANAPASRGEANARSLGPVTSFYSELFSPAITLHKLTYILFAPSTLYYIPVPTYSYCYPQYRPPTMRILLRLLAAISVATAAVILRDVDATGNVEVSNELTGTPGAASTSTSTDAVAGYAGNDRSTYRSVQASSLRARDKDDAVSARSIRLMKETNWIRLRSTFKRTSRESISIIQRQTLTITSA